jgi:outer membrane protease
MIGYRYQDFSYEIFGVKGWQLDQHFERWDFDEFKGVNVLDYDVSYRLPYLGLAGELKGYPTFTLAGTLAYSPKTMAKDRDDHILRNKLSRSNCEGTSFLAGLNAIWILSDPGRRPLWYLEIGGEIVSTDTEGHQDQV